MKGISVVICCYNSADRIAETLKHLAVQQFKDASWEIVVVDNESKDTTALIARETWKSLTDNRLPLIVVREPRQGLSHARKRGVEESSYECVVFCDDDNWLAPDYLAVAWEVMQRDTSIGAVGGQSNAITHGELPTWFSDFQNGYAVGKPASHTRNTTRRKSVWGAGMVTRKQLYLDAFPENCPSLLTDRKGELLAAGGDTEYVMRLIWMGFQLYYDERLRFAHFIPKERLAESYRDRLFDGFRESERILVPCSRQCDIALLKWYEFPVFTLKTIAKLVLSNFLGIRRYSFRNEAMKLYHLTGISFVEIDAESSQVRAIYKKLKASWGIG